MAEEADSTLQSIKGGGHMLSKVVAGDGVLSADIIVGYEKRNHYKYCNFV